MSFFFLHIHQPIILLHDSLEPASNSIKLILLSPLQNITTNRREDNKRQTGGKHTTFCQSHGLFQMK